MATVFGISVLFKCPDNLPYSLRLGSKIYFLLFEELAPAPFTLSHGATSDDGILGHMRFTQKLKFPVLAAEALELKLVNKLQGIFNYELIICEVAHLGDFHEVSTLYH